MKVAFATGKSDMHSEDNAIGGQRNRHAAGDPFKYRVTSSLERDDIDDTIAI
jgi:hypothetical protein